MEDLKFKDKHGVNVQIGDVCHFFWNPILQQDSAMFDYELPIVYLPEFASYGFKIEAKDGRYRNVSLWAISEFTEFGFEKSNK